MAFDGLVMAAVAQELTSGLVGGRVEKIQQPTTHELILVIHTREKGKQRLLISADARDARIHFTQASHVNPLSPPIFCMVLRKHLEGGRIRSVEQIGLERILQFTVDSRDELGRPGEKHLICEVMGKHSNILLVDPTTNTILDGIHRYSHAVSRYREVLPNRPYLSPPEQSKFDPRKLTEDQFREILMSGDIDLKVTDIFLQRIAGVGPLTCRELVFRAGLAVDYRLEHCGDYELTQLWQQIQYLGELLEKGYFQPTLLLDRRELPVDFSAIDLSHLKFFKKETGSISHVLDGYYRKIIELRQLESFRHSLLQTVRKEIGRLKKKISLYQKSLASAEKADEYRIFGELLTANLYQIDQGKEARVQNFYDPAGTETIIAMDSSLTPSQNAQEYFRKYLKAKNTRNAVTQQLEQAESELNYLDAVDTALSQAMYQEDLKEIRSELEEQAYLKPKIQQVKNRSQKEKLRPQPMSFLSSEGFTILVGKNNKQNDYLSLRLASEDDIWLHTKDIPGSHVIIRNPAGEVPNQTLLEAATLAAWFSKSRQSGKVPVDFTLRRHVRKPKGAKPGMVIYDNQQTLYVAPSEELVDQLAAKKD
ncbi:Fibronectin-binding A domain protein [Desulforamulus reducens MI-1]|uniref:Rqc2 homolog RqcH n=1 Tax=Desulforamulus reducens (strain ATCC BAA-1160 / DSM 100696 / MI-1) TaxID=349161 RepID=A4J565_DESRM|nr:NFACT RNA binding domain-containing protein [Desulforamulus reducens]ABO50218.1 Fibronectin-binding A domain protein [Desulforamulus reducens MI-1]